MEFPSCAAGILIYCRNVIAEKAQLGSCARTLASFASSGVM